MSEQSDCEKNCDKTPGLISWNELISHDARASADFYTALFGWTLEDASMEGISYSIFKTGERSVAGMVQLSPERKSEVPGMWINYVTVGDIEASVAKACELGAKVCKEITTLPMGRFSVLLDPQGAAIGLWQFA